jgi:alpha-L-rhamnosidase
MLQLSSLTTEHRTAPLGIDVARPRLGWQLVSDRRGVQQTAYQVLVASSPDGPFDLWDSGRVESDQSVDVVYAGAPLASRLRAHWRVRVWDETGTMAESAPTWWETGLLARNDWQGAWIGGSLVGGHRTTIPCPYLRRSFAVEGEVVTARLYVACLGVHDCTLNGQPVGTDVLSPGWTDFHQRVRYQVYDVAGLLHTGENALGAILGDGWYCGHTEKYRRQAYGDRPKLLAQLEITYADGRRETVATDTAWRCAYGPVLEADLIHGESYDARLEMPGWDAPGFGDAAWWPALTFPDTGAALVASNGPLISRMGDITPVTAPTQVGRAWVFDLGQNMVGRVRLRVSGSPGETVRLRFAERLQPDGGIYTDNLRTARATDYYTLRGSGEEVWESRFTFHGFQYVEITGMPGAPTRQTVTGVVLHSDMAPTGEFACSHPVISQLQHNIQWGQKGNFLDVPTDCPQRDERLGWTGDAQVFARTAAFNMDVDGFFEKWLQDIRDAQCTNGGVPPIIPSSHLGKVEEDGGPAWSDATVIVPWTLYLAYGDTRVLEEHYPSMVRYLDFLQATSRDYRRGYDGMPASMGFGDWLSMDGDPNGADSSGGTSKELIGTAFFAHAARLMGRIAAVLGKADEAARYDALFGAVRDAFQRRYFTPYGLVAGLTQTGYVLALHFDLLPADLRAVAVAELVAGIRRRGMHLATGFIGTPYLAHVLASEGYLDVAYALLEQTTWPSWLYAVTQGATTIWERWDGWTQEKGFQRPGMNSFNHYAFGAIGDWLYGTVAGIEIDADQPGYKHAVLRPRPGGTLTWARGAVHTRYGLLASEWRIDGDTFLWDILVPPNTTATAAVPTRDAGAITEGGLPATHAEGVVHLHGTTYRLASGHYRFAAPAGQ